MILELSFPVFGKAPLPAHHSLLVYRALTSIVPRLRCCRDVAVLPITGRRVGDRLLLLLPWSELTLLLPDVRIGEFLALSGKWLQLGQQVIRLGTPQVRVPTVLAELPAVQESFGGIDW